MNNVNIDMIELFLDKISSIVLDSLTNQEVMYMIKDELYWGGENPFDNSFNSELEKEIQQYEEIYYEFLKNVDQSYFDQLAECEEIKREIFKVA